MTQGVFAARLCAAVALCVAAVVPGNAQTYPTRAVELVVPFAAGGGTDLLARLVAEGLSKRLGQSFVPLNRPGGNTNTNTGTLQVVKSAPDGHTLVMASIGLAANPSLYRKLPFDPLADLSPISLIANSPTVLVVPPDLPVNTVAEFVAHLKANPGALNYASYGAGSGPHLATELFRSMTGVDIVHVPYSGGGPAVVGVMSGSVQMLFASVLPVLGAVRGGKLKAIAIASAERSPLLPNVPTFQESGVDYRTGTWFGLLAPARTPDAIVAALHREVVDTLREASVRDRIVEQGAEVVGNSPAEFRAFIKNEAERLAAVVRNAKMQLD
ncbi:MAG: tripartite tricarboxylate transporter substrate binding protein [Alphaproteobacteria bacterium]|nr:tripartite tricarboxylate transporter substrate binding protein [Alphaproteobacteria bacterium]